VAFLVKNEMRHPVNGEAWQDFDREYPNFTRDARNLRLGLATDGSILFWNRTQNIACGCICCAIQPPTLGMHAGVELHDCFAYTRPFVTWEGL